MRVIALVAILCGVLFVYGFITDDGMDRMTLKTLSEKRLVTVIVGLPDVDERYHWLTVYGCSAEITETGSYCTGDFERESTQEMFGRKQYLFGWRDLPGGTLQITAMAFDGNQKVLARASTVLLRGW